MIETEFSEVLREIVFSHLPFVSTKIINELVEDILNHTGRLDYRMKFDELTYEHSKCLMENTYCDAREAIDERTNK